MRKENGEHFHDVGREPSMNDRFTLGFVLGMQKCSLNVSKK